MAPRIAAPPRPPDRRLLRLVEAGPSWRDAVEVPEPELAACVDAGAVGAGEDGAVVRRDRDEAVELDPVPDCPGGDDNRESPDCGAEAEGSAPAAARPGEWEGQERHEEHALAPRQGSQSQSRPQR